MIFWLNLNTFLTHYEMPYSYLYAVILFCVVRNETQTGDSTSHPDFLYLR